MMQWGRLQENLVKFSDFKSSGGQWNYRLMIFMASGANFFTAGWFRMWRFIGLNGMMVWFLA